MASQQLIVFNVNGVTFGIEIMQVNEIIPPQEIFKIPNAPEYIEGMLNLRGNVHTVFSLRKRFNMPDKELDDNTKIIIAHVDSMSVGLIVDEVAEIITVQEENIESPSKPVRDFDEKFMKGIVKVNDREIIVIDLHEIVLDT